MKTYKDIYEFPLRVDVIGWVYDNKNQFVFQFEFDESLLQHNIVAILNGKEKPVKQHSFVYEAGDITEDGKHYITIRGRGNLTGTGGHNLSEEEAANIQDTFAEYIVNTLNQNK